eukprot:3935479-Rhodomonas_salina.2
MADSEVCGCGTTCPLTRSMRTDVLSLDRRDMSYMKEVLHTLGKPAPILRTAPFNHVQSNLRTEPRQHPRLGHQLLLCNSVARSLRDCGSGSESHASITRETYGFVDLTTTAFFIEWDATVVICLSSSVEGRLQMLAVGSVENRSSDVSSEMAH